MKRRQLTARIGWQAFVHVTLPSLRPVIAFVVVVSMIGSLQLF